MPWMYSSTASTSLIWAARRSGEYFRDMASMREFTSSMATTPARKMRPILQSMIMKPSENTSACRTPARMRTTMAPAMDSRSSMVDVQMAVRLPRLRSLK